MFPAQCFQPSAILALPFGCRQLCLQRAEFCLQRSQSLLIARYGFLLVGDLLIAGGHGSDIIRWKELRPQRLRDPLLFACVVDASQLKRQRMLVSAVAAFQIM